MCKRKPYLIILSVITTFVVLFVGGCDGDDKSVNPDPQPLTVTDIDCNVYETVTIGTQVWMAENLKVTHYRNGDAIPNVTDNGAWAGLSTGACCEYDNNIANSALYGRLYNWYSVADIRNIAPEGWHVASDAEWKQLEMYLGMDQADVDNVGLRGTDEGGKLKETGTTHWASTNFGATNESGFTALPGGCRDQDSTFGCIGMTATFWSSTENISSSAWGRDLGYLDSGTYRYSSFKENGFSVRCMKD
ncbi:MAG: fibrobacter succinogenes major paralogous domain-containing protein [candidate division Zixibacteria bacterium]|nr:fibrobacter succinogenes major paralogous domain-containing protein [candidate division Zixibacteria bacterium]